MENFSYKVDTCTRMDSGLMYCGYRNQGQGPITFCVYRNQGQGPITFVPKSYDTFYNLP